MQKRIYFDHSATTKAYPQVVEKIMPYLTEDYGNPNSQHCFGRTAMEAVDEARDTVAQLINAKPSEIYFTSGGTEADNWAIKGIASANSKKGKHVIISSIEHPALSQTADELTKIGYSVTKIAVDKDGVIDPQKVKDAIKKDTVFIGVMLVNNEIGTIQPVKEIAKIGKEYGITTFSDCVQAIPSIRIDVKDLGVDAVCFSAHKIGGIKGAGVLYVRTGVLIDGLITGGHQERTRRGGTTNVPAVVALAEALKITYATLEDDVRYVRDLRDYFIKRVEEEIPTAKLNGSREKRVACNANFYFKGVKGETLLFNLDLKGIAVSSGSACSTGSILPSAVLTAIGLTEDEAKSSVRFSFNKTNTKEEVDYCIEVLKEYAM